MRVYKSPHKDVELPHLDILTFLFGTAARSTGLASMLIVA